MHRQPNLHLSSNPPTHQTRGQFVKRNSYVTAQATVILPSGDDAAKTRHALLLFIRQPIGTEYDLENARKTVEVADWETVVIGKSGKLAAEPNADNETLMSAHREAAENGCSIVVYDEPIEDATGGENAATT